MAAHGIQGCYGGEIKTDTIIIELMADWKF